MITMRWTEIPIHFIDFEGSIASGILEYGVVTLRGGRVERTRTRFCRATGRVRNEDAAIHGLTAGLVAHSEPFATDGEFAYFAGLRETGPLGAHFAHAENSLIKSAWPYSRQSPDFARGGSHATAEWGPWIDTGRLYAEVFPQLKSCRLETLVAAFGLQAELDLMAAEHCPEGRRRYHAALYDALAAALLLVSLGRRAEFSNMTVPWLLQTSTANPEKRDAMRQEELF
ncbi:3'-5' exonuclease [Ereboglobus sp. PH5-10]|uniref:3'-5' exonuclease n=1 Tax=Ereboglobus sp. PH5-10 TaxID=2940629 RepID=UPI002404A610|nr:3'-5' exonuclease [Ereboglobus sp. PH5-10]